MPSRGLGRRDFLKRAGGLALAGCVSSLGLAAGGDTLPNPVGYATIAWPGSRFHHALETISGLGFQGVQLLGWVRDAYSGSRAEALRERLRALKLQPVALSCTDVVLDPAREGKEGKPFRRYAFFWQQLQGLYLQVADSGRPNGDYSAEQIASLGRRLNTLGRLAQDLGLTLGYHPHFGTFGETRQGLGRLLDATDPHYVKLIADVAHLTLGGADPVEVVRTYQQRLILTHFKDVRKDVAELARQDRDLVRRKRYQFCEIGRGVVDFPAIVRAFREIQFRGWIVVELDGYQHGPGGADASARTNQQAAHALGLNV
jgi:inosose dehydratase